MGLLGDGDLECLLLWTQSKDIFLARHIPLPDKAHVQVCPVASFTALRLHIVSNSE